MPPIGEKDAKNHLISLKQKMKLHREKDKLNDVVLIAGCDGKRVSARRVVLATASPYFEAMFMGSMRESTEKEVTISDVNGDVLEMIVNYCYSGVINLDKTNMEMALVTADLLQLDTVKKNCAESMAAELHETNCLGILAFAERHNCSDLQESAQRYAIENFQKVCQGKELQLLSAEQLGKLLANDDLNIHHEKEVFQCLMSWVQHDEVNRKQHLPQLLPHVRLPLIDAKFIIDHMEKIYMDNGCLHLLYIIFRSKCSNNGTLGMRARKSSEEYILCLGKSKVHCYNPQTNQWNMIPDIKVDRTGFAACLLGNEIVIAGGCGYEKLVKFWNLRDNTYKMGASMNSGRYNFVLLELGGFLYAMGGPCDVSVERYDPTKGVWEFVQPMPTKIYGGSIAVLSGCIYLGKDSSIFCYQPSRNVWTNIKCPENCSNISIMMEQNNLLYIFCESNRVFRYDKGTQIWKEFNCSNEFSLYSHKSYLNTTFNNRLKGAIGYKGNYDICGFYLPQNVLKESGNKIIGAKRLPCLLVEPDSIFIAAPASSLPLSILNLKVTTWQKIRGLKLYHYLWVLIKYSVYLFITYFIILLLL